MAMLNKIAYNGTKIGINESGITEAAFSICYDNNYIETSIGLLKGNYIIGKTLRKTCMFIICFALEF